MFKVLLNKEADLKDSYMDPSTFHREQLTSSLGHFDYIVNLCMLSTQKNLTIDKSSIYSRKWYNVHVHICLFCMGWRGKQCIHAVNLLSVRKIELKKQTQIL